MNTAADLLAIVDCIFLICTPTTTVLLFVYVSSELLNVTFVILNFGKYFVTQMNCEWT